MSSKWNDGAPSFSKVQVSSLRTKIRPLSSMLDNIVDISREAEVIMIGESSHGTSEQYLFRIELTKQLITAGRLQAILLEGDWPDCAELHRFVNGDSRLSVDDVFQVFERFPSWMWANEEMRSFVLWLKTHNASLPPIKRTAIFGLDIYSLHSSMEAVIRYLQEHDVEMQARVRSDYGKFCLGGGTLGGESVYDPQTYGMLAHRGLIKGCHEAAVSALSKISSQTSKYAREDPRDGLVALDEAFINEQNARCVVSAEEYYRMMFEAGVSSWNIRDTHFFDTVVRVKEHLRATRNPGNWQQQSEVRAGFGGGEEAPSAAAPSLSFKATEGGGRGGEGVDVGSDDGGGGGFGGTEGDAVFDRVVLFAHNSHIGDARFTHLEQKMMSADGGGGGGGGGTTQQCRSSKEEEISVGQLVRERFPPPLSFSIGQFFYSGTVCAADDWGGAHKQKRVNNALPDSYEDVFQAVSKKSGQPVFCLDLRDSSVAALLAEPRLQRAIGVIYRPQTERHSHYYLCDLKRQFDSVVWLGINTKGVLPLVDEESAAEEPETFPSGL